MKRLIIILTLFTALISTIYVAYQYIVLLDEVQPLDTNNSFTIKDLETTTKKDAKDQIQRLAEKYEVNVYKIEAAKTNSLNDRVLYVYVGDDTLDETIIMEKYPNLNKENAKTTIENSANITTQDLRGRYVFSSNSIIGQQFINDLNRAGIKAQLSNINYVEAFMLTIGRLNFAPNIAIILLIILVVVGYDIVSDIKVYALQRAHGYTITRRIFLIIKRIGIDYLLSAAICLLLFLMIHKCVYDGGQTARVIWAIFVGILVLFAYITVAICVMYCILAQDSIVMIVKGYKPNVAYTVLNITVSYMMIVVIVFSLINGTTRYTAIKASLNAARSWITSGSLYTLRLSPTGTRNDDERVATPLAKVTNDLEGSGQVLYVHPGTDPDTSPFYRDGLKTMEVNAEYLNRHTIIDLTNNRITNLEGAPGTYWLIIPETYHGDVSLLVQNFDKSLKSTCTIFMPEGTPPCNPRAIVIRAKGNYNLPTYENTYESPVELAGEPLLHNPIIAVVNTNSGLIAPLDYVSYVSLGYLLYSNYDSLNRELKTFGIYERFQGIDDAASAVRISIRISQNELIMDVVSTLIAFLLLISCVIISISIFIVRRNRIIFLQTIHGYSYGKKYSVYYRGVVFINLAAIITSLYLFSFKQGYQYIFLVIPFFVSIIISAIILYHKDKQIRFEAIKKEE